MENITPLHISDAEYDRARLAKVRYVVTAGTLPVTETIVEGVDAAIALADKTGGTYARIWNESAE